MTRFQILFCFLASCSILLHIFSEVHAHRCIHNQLDTRTLTSRTQYRNHPFEVIRKVGANEYFKKNMESALPGGNTINWVNVISSKFANQIKENKKIEENDSNPTSLHASNSKSSQRLSKVYSPFDEELSHIFEKNELSAGTFFNLHASDGHNFESETLKGISLKDIRNFDMNEVHKASGTDTTWKRIRINFVKDKVSSSVVLDILDELESLLSNLLFVYPVEGNLQLERTCLQFWLNNGRPFVPNRCTEYYMDDTCGNDYGTIPSNYFKSQPVYSSFSPTSVIGETEGGAGVTNTDLLLFVTDTVSSTCASSVIAYAAPCFRDQYDRPIAGYINVCQKDDVESLKNVMTHEIFHVLGITASQFSRFRRPDGSTYSNPLIAFTERDTTVVRLNVDPATDIARSHFQCNTLPGIELENQGGSGTAFSHLERRVFETELMVGELTTHPTLSPISISILESSNWYRVNYTMAERLSWGAKVGCNFAYASKCLTGSNPDSINPDHFCTSASSQRCTVDMLSKGSCSLTLHSNEIEPAFRYFSNPRLGGRPSMDFCPAYLSVQKCTDSTSSTRGEIFGTTSKCLHNTLSTNASPSDFGPGCFQISCSADGTSLSLIITTSNSETVTCAPGEEGEEKTISGYSGTLTCPSNYDIACETKPYADYVVNTEGCIFNCRNGGKCINGKCDCPNGYIGDICEYSSDGISKFKPSIILLIIALVSFFLM